MRITYDPEVDSMYIKFSLAKPAKQSHINDDTTLDLDEEGKIIGVEILGATELYGRDIINLDFSLLGEITKEESQKQYTPVEAAEILQVNKETILRKIRIGEIRARRLGRSYRINKAEIDRLLSV